MMKVSRELWFGRDVGDYVAILSFDDRDVVPHWIDWKLVEIFGIDTENTHLFRLDDAIGSTPIEEINKAEADAEGFCKWDGCSELKVDVHVCSPRDLFKLLDALKRVYIECAKITGRDALAMCEEAEE